MNFHFKLNEVILVSISLLIMGFAIGFYIYQTFTFTSVYIILSSLIASLTFLVRARKRAKVMDENRSKWKQNISTIN